MTLVLVDQGEEHFLSLILGVNYTLRLFQNDVTDGLTAAQVEALTEADFMEADFTGYSAAALTGGAWTIAAGAPCVGTYPTQAFTSSANQTQQTLYGYYVTRTSGGALEWFEEFAAPVVVEFNSELLRVTPRMTLADTGD